MLTNNKPSCCVAMQFEIYYFEGCLKLAKMSPQLLNVGLSPSKKLFYLLQWKPFKNDENCFIFRLKSFFRSHDI